MSASQTAVQWAFPMTEVSQVAEVRRCAATLAQRLGFDETQAGALALVVTEAGTNLVKHAKEGQLILRALEGTRGPSVEVMALDRGPGMADLQACFRDGYSTGMTLGTGLGAIRRQADHFDIHSEPDHGTAILARVGARRARPAPSAPAGALEAGVVNLPIRGEDLSGDSWAVRTRPRFTRALVVDGLGHGPLAAEAAAGAVQAFGDQADRPLLEVIERIHEALRQTRGAVAALTELSVETRCARFVGIGNVAAYLWTPARQDSLVSMNGTLGHTDVRAREFTYPWAEGALLIMHSDGLQSRWSLDDYRGLGARDPSLVAGVLYRDFRRGNDDVTVLVLRETEAAWKQPS